MPDKYDKFRASQLNFSEARRFAEFVLNKHHKHEELDIFVKACDALNTLSLLFFDIPIQLYQLEKLIINKCYNFMSPEEISNMKGNGNGHRE